MSLRSSANLYASDVAVVDGAIVTVGPEVYEVGLAVGLTVDSVAEERSVNCIASSSTWSLAVAVAMLTLLASSMASSIVAFVTMLAFDGVALP